MTTKLNKDKLEGGKLVSVKDHDRVVREKRQKAAKATVKKPAQGE